METEINGLMVSYLDEGARDAPVVIFLHGFPFNKSMWQKQVKALSERYRVIAYDIRGHGSSGVGDEAFSVRLFAEDLIALMDRLLIGKAVLCGLSMGGYIALRAVIDHPERFDGLVLCDTQCIADTPEAKEKRLKAIESIRENGAETYAEGSLKNFFAPESFTAGKEEVAAVRGMIAGTREQTLVQTLRALYGREETCGALKQIKMPVLIMVGKEDKITPPSAAEAMHARMKLSALHVIEGAGHLSNMENPEAFNERLKEFVASVY
jgi:3-oxoadipate enol-lactonase